MKTSITALAILSTLTFSSALKAEDVKIPEIKVPSILKEGTQRELSADQINELLPWAKNSKMFLNDLLESLQGIDAQTKRERLLSGIEEVVKDSGSKQSELFMRYVLNRALVLEEIIGKEMEEDSVGTVDAKVRLLIESVKMSLRYYDTDIAFMSKNTAAPYAKFASEYFNFLRELNKSIFDASAQYTIERTALEFAQWDLYRDQNNTVFAPQIIKIFNNLKLFPSGKKLKDPQYIAFIRQLKALGGQLKIEQGLATIATQQKAVVDKIENERRAKQLEKELAEKAIRNQKELAENAKKLEAERMIQEEKMKKEEERIKKEVIKGIQVIQSPSVSGIRFTLNSSPIQVCRALGYEKVIPGNNPSETIANNTVAIKITEDGKMYGDTNKSTALIKEITCADKNIKTKPLSVELVTKPFLDNAAFLTNSDSVGLCRFLGFETGVMYSTIAGEKVTSETPSAMLDENGNAKRGFKMTPTAYLPVKGVVCINRKSEAKKKLIMIEDPKFQNAALSSNSNGNGACKILGYEEGPVDGLVFKERNDNTTMLVIGENAAVVGTQVAARTTGYYASSAYQISKMVCVKKL